MARSLSSSSSSSSSDDQSKKEPTRSSNPSRNQLPHTPAMTTTMTTTINSSSGAPSPPIGYPPIMGYPPPYQPHPPNGHHHHPYNPYTQPPPPHYYTNQHYSYPTPTTTGAGGGSSFVRGFLAMIITLIIVTCIATVITWLVLRPEIPIFHVDRLTVSGLNLSSPGFSAKWEASVTVENPNHKLKIYLDQIEGFVYYKESFLSSSPADPMFLETKSRNAMAIKLATNNTEEHSVGHWVVEEIANERKGGAVSFNVRMLVLATFKSGAWWTRHASMKVFCGDLKVDFVGGEISGVLDNNVGVGKTKECAVYYA